MFDFEGWFREKGKQARIQISIPVQGFEKPAKMTLEGVCIANLEGLAEAALEQVKPIRVSLPPTEMETINGTAKVSRSALFDKEDVAEMLLDGLGNAEKGTDVLQQRIKGGLVNGNGLEV